MFTPSSGRGPVDVPRLAAESLVIVVSVLVALSADAWWAARIEAEQERQALRLILSNLEGDAAVQEQYIEVLLEQESASRQLLAQLERGAPPDSIALAAATARTVYNYRPLYAAFDGLRASGRLDLIQDAELRDALINYHDFWVSYLDDLRADVGNRSDALKDALNPYMGFVPDPAGSSEAGEDWTFEVTGDLEAARLDTELQNLVGENGRVRHWLVQRIRNRFLPQNRALQELLRDHLSMDGPA